ncbi:MFS transporter [Neorhizobium alkalisoli]|uniref:MFS transporter n=1 Tax=Neorhizobium alkalisoli TaxID=528178 RepID=A0A561QCC6_9HYPH|nr:MFS transporter [Neorhizobium alkalisoli]
MGVAPSELAKDEARSDVQTARQHFYHDDESFDYPEGQRPALPGSPGFPDHPAGRRAIYGLTAVIIGITGALGNAIVAANLPYIQGSLGLDLSEVAWLPAAYFVTNAITGCILVKYRQQFGVRSFCMVFLALQAVLITSHLFVNGLAGAILVRAASGVSASALTTLGVFYMMQAFPAAHRLRAVCLGVGTPQLSLPLAWLVPKDFLALGNWNGLYLFELGLSLAALGIVSIVRLPPGVRSKAFEPLDALSFSLYAVGFVMFGSAMGLGSYLWWTNVAWIGWFFAACLPCFALFFFIEARRAKPLIDVKWLSAGTFVGWALIAVLCRFVQSEQTIGILTMLRDFGLTNDDTRPLTGAIFVGAVVGLVAAALIVAPPRLPLMVFGALALVAVATYIDTGSSVSTRVPQLLVSQPLIAFAGTLFIGPVFIFGLGRVLADGGVRMTSFIALFNVTQSVGTLTGNAFTQTYLFHAQQYHLGAYAAQATRSDPEVAALLSTLAARYAPVITDPATRSAEGVAALSQQVTQYARVAAYIDVFTAISLAASAGAVALLAFIAVSLFKQYRSKPS